MTSTVRDKSRGASVQPGSRSACVVARELTKEYPGGIIAAKAVSIEAFDGEIVGVVGPNGAGKSTTLKMLATLITPTSGSASICGFSLGDVAKVRPLLGVALQDLGLDPLMTGAEHFSVQAAISGRRPAEVRARMNELVELLALGPYIDRSVGAYSGGTQRRLALALALLGDPRVVIFDEPTAGLDPRARRDVWHLVEQLRSDGHTVLFSTQYLEEADRLCDRLYLIDHGTIVAAGRPYDLKAELGRSTLEIEFEDGHDLDAALLVRTLPVTIEVAEGSELRLRFDRNEVEVETIFQHLDPRQLPVRTITLSEPTLDDVFFHFTQRSLSPEPLEQNGMDLGTRMHRGGGKRWE
jgi:ABC-type multidrug transport system ATPase subunit